MQTFSNFPSKLLSSNINISSVIRNSISNARPTISHYAIIWIRALRSISLSLLNSASHYAKLTTIWMNENRRTVLILCLVPVTVYLSYKVGCYWTGNSVYKSMARIPWAHHGRNATFNIQTGMKWLRCGPNAGFTLITG